jgi:RNA polymerase sigma factor (TIGR02999 family)
MNTATDASSSDGFDSENEDNIGDLYQELRQMARGKLSGEARQQTLGATALVHEAWLRVEKSAPDKWRDRGQFFAAASEAMRRILIEAARKRLAAKRGAGQEVVPLHDIDVAEGMQDEHLLAVNEALQQLEREDPQRAEVVKMRFFSGLQNEEIAALLGVNEKTVRRHWAVARVWLYRWLQADGA